MITVKNIAALGSSKAVSICYKNNQSISLHSSHEKRNVSPKPWISTLKTLLLNRLARCIMHWLHYAE